MDTKVSTPDTYLHKGVVSRIDAGAITVTLDADAHCASCRAKAACGVSDAVTREIRIPGAGTGFALRQPVEVCLRKNLGWQAVFWAYVFPFLLLITVLLVASSYLEEWLAGLMAAWTVAATTWACGSGTSTPGFESLTGGTGGSDAGGASMVGDGGSGGVSATSSAGGAGGAEPEKLGPPYPIVLAHGFFGFEDFAGAGFLTYFYQVKDHLASEGETLVFTPSVDPFNSSAYRGAQLLDRIEEILDETGHAKVNIIGHSQGGLDARVVAHDRPDLVASVITLQTPHGGTPISDIALELVADPNLADVLDFLVQVVGAPLYDEVGQQTSLADALYQFSEPGIAAFTAAYPDQPGIYYASIAGRSDLHPGGDDCDAPNAPSFVSDFDGVLDPIDPLLDIPEQIVDGGLLSAIPNDGLVRVEDAKHGVFLGCLPADHLDMVGQLLGDDPGLLNDWDYKQFYVDLVKHIRDQGL